MQRMIMLSLYVVKQHAMKTYGTSTLHESEWSASRSGRFISRKEKFKAAGWALKPIQTLEGTEKLLPLLGMEFKFPARPARILVTVLNGLPRLRMDRLHKAQRHSCKHLQQDTEHRYCANDKWTSDA
jgi:hypothetical protein